jgi:hypothetical protein
VWKWTEYVADDFNHGRIELNFFFIKSLFNWRLEHVDNPADKFFVLYAHLDVLKLLYLTHIILIKVIM